MAFSKTQFRDLISRVLSDAKLHSPEAVELLMMTAAVESGLGTYLVQVGGPAKGVFQMEPATERDIWDNYIKYKPELQATLLSYMGTQDGHLEWNLAYQILMSRIHYLRKSEPLPAATDINGMAKFWKKHYNSHLGKGTEQKAIAAYHRFCV